MGDRVRGILIIWDRMFGTFAPERFRPHYGLTKQVDTDKYRAINADLRGASRWRDRLGYLVGPPGWQPA